MQEDTKRCFCEQWWFMFGLQRAMVHFTSSQHLLKRPPCFRQKKSKKINRMCARKASKSIFSPIKLVVEATIERDLNVFRLCSISCFIIPSILSLALFSVYYETGRPTILGKKRHSNVESWWHPDNSQAPFCSTDNIITTWSHESYSNPTMKSNNIFWRLKPPSNSDLSLKVDVLLDGSIQIYNSRQIILNILHLCVVNTQLQYLEVDDSHLPASSASISTVYSYAYISTQSTLYH